MIFDITLREKRVLAVIVVLAGLCLLLRILLCN